MSFFGQLAAAFIGGSSVRGIDERPEHLMRCLLRARVRPQKDGTVCVIIEARDRIGSHETFSRLQLRLVRDNGEEIPLVVVEQKKLSGFPVKCLAQPAGTVVFDELERPDVRVLRVSYRNETRDIEISNAAESQ